MEFLKLFIVALVVLFIGCGGYPSTPEEIAVNAIKASINGDVETLAKYFGIDEITKNESDKTAMKGQLFQLASREQKRAEKMGGVKEIKVIETIDKGDVKRVKIKVTYANGEIKNNNVNLKQLKNKWIVTK